jgi:hypothetical protein
LPERERPPKILEIYRDFVKPGREAQFKAVEEDAARICAELSFPHHHLAIESLAGPSEVWWLNGFDSQAEIQQVRDDYARNPALVAALGGIGPRREPLIQSSVDLFATYRADLSLGAPWRIAGTRLFVVTVTPNDPPGGSSVFEAPDGTRFGFRPAATPLEAEAVAATVTPGARIFAVRPHWGMPAPEWIAADPEFWRVSPMTRSS